MLSLISQFIDRSDPESVKWSKIIKHNIIIEIARPDGPAEIQR
jgi:hypothetical protein